MKPRPSTRALTLFVSSLAYLLALTATMAAPNRELKLWPGVPPGDETFKAPTTKAEPKNDGTLRIAVVTEPTLTIFQAPAGRANGAAVIVCPGGGYNILAWDKEGTEIAEWLNRLGVTAAVLKYRVPRRDPKDPHVAPLRDGQRALRLVRQNAAAWGIDPARVGILGFSAGGHLAVMAGVAWEKSTYSKLDAADELSARPDFVLPIYPAYLGDEKKAGPLSPLLTITSKTPPMFIAVTHDDQLRGVNAALLYVELKKADVAAELHIFTRGGHGYGMRPSADPVSGWPKLAEGWLRAMKYIPAL